MCVVYSSIDFKKQICNSCVELYYFGTAEVVEGRDVADYARICNSFCTAEVIEGSDVCNRLRIMEGFIALFCTPKVIAGSVFTTHARN